MTKSIHPFSRANLPGLSARYQSEKRFRLYGKVAVFTSLAFLFFLIGAIAYRGAGAFTATEIQLEISKTKAVAAGEDYFSLLRKSALENFPDAKSRSEKKAAYNMVAVGAEETLQAYLTSKNIETLPETFSIWLPASDDVDLALKSGLGSAIVEKLGEKQLGWIRDFQTAGKLRSTFNMTFLTAGDSRDPERAGIGGALLGSIFTLLVCLFLSFTVGIFAAIYLEEFAPKNKLTAFLEININNLATVPSIIFGLLGLAVFLNLFGLPRSSALAGGMVLAPMTLPTIIISSRVAIQAVPPSIKEAALGVGASHMQAVFHHLLPLALPGMLTGTILGMARALGETAPLMMIGMVAFIADLPTGFTAPATALPVQVFLWSDSPERAFQEKTAGAILILLVFLGGHELDSHHFA